MSRLFLNSPRLLQYYMYLNCSVFSTVLFAAAIEFLSPRGFPPLTSHQAAQGLRAPRLLLSPWLFACSPGG